MKRVFCLLAFSLLLTVSAEAKCNAYCKSECKRDPGAQSVAACIRLWSCIIEKRGAEAKQFVNRTPPPECAHLYKPTK
jgi:hypothetical protein